MLVALANSPRDYAWGSTTLLARLQGREPSGRPEAEIWLGDHPGSPAVTSDGRTLDVWLAEEREGERLPFLLKLLAAAAPLSIQAHPSRAQAAAGFAREEAAGIPRDAEHRLFRDENHKPELIVALSDEFVALAGFRDAAQTLRLLDDLGAAAAGLRKRVADAAPSAVIAWVLSPDAAPEVAAIVSAARSASSADFADELALVIRLDDAYPGDPGVVVALLMNLVRLRRGEGIFIPAGVLHAYQSGLGVELMAASDNVMRGGITPKHVDVDELVAVLDDDAGEVAIVRPEAVPEGDGALCRYPVPVDDFALVLAEPSGGEAVRIPVMGTSIAVATVGEVALEAERTGVALRLAPGEAALVTDDEGAVLVTGTGELFLAGPGA